MLIITVSNDKGSHNPVTRGGGCDTGRQARLYNSGLGLGPG